MHLTYLLTQVEIFVAFIFMDLTYGFNIDCQIIPEIFVLLIYFCWVVLKYYLCVETFEKRPFTQFPRQA